MEVKLLTKQEHESVLRIHFNELNGYRTLAQHTYEWQSILAKREDWYCLALVDNMRVIGLLPFCMRERSMGKVIMSNPYPASYGGILYDKNYAYPVCYILLLRELIDFGKNNDVDIITIFTSPFRNDIELYKKYFQPTYVHETFYQYLPVGFKSKWKSKHRYNMNRIELMGDKEYKFKYFSTIPEQIFIDWYNILRERFIKIGVKLSNYHWLYDVAKVGDFSCIKENNKLIGGAITLGGYCKDIYSRVTASENLKKQNANMYLDIKLIDLNKPINFQSSPKHDDNIYKYKKNRGCIEGANYYLTKVLKNEDKFLGAGKNKVMEEFDNYFVLPYEVYNGKI